MLLSLTVCAAALSACGSLSSVRLVEPRPLVLSPPPQELMEKREPNLRQRLLQLSSESPETVTQPSDN